jgi:hypothetical protein
MRRQLASSVPAHREQCSAVRKRVLRELAELDIGNGGAGARRRCSVVERRRPRGPQLR